MTPLEIVTAINAGNPFMAIDGNGNVVDLYESREQAIKATPPEEPHVIVHIREVTSAFYE